MTLANQQSTSRPTAIVTGASRGIGRAIALRLATDYDIVAAARSKPELESLKSEIEARGGACRVIPIDLTQPDAVDAAFSGMDTHVLVNNAGMGVLKPFMELTRAEWRRMVDLNFNALYDVTHAVLPSMLQRGYGHIVVIGSVTGRTASVGGTCYAATKHAVMGFTECLMLEVRDAGVKVSVVNPASTATHFSERSDPSWMLAPEEVAEAVAQVIATPADVLIHRVEIRALSPKKKS